VTASHRRPQEPRKGHGGQPTGRDSIVHVVDEVVARIRAVEGDLSKWDADVPVTKPLTEVQIAKKLPTFGIALGEAKPHVRGKIREFVSL
jgi:hypothetical protein